MVENIKSPKKYSHEKVMRKKSATCRSRDAVNPLYNPKMPSDLSTFMPILTRPILPFCCVCRWTYTYARCDIYNTIKMDCRWHFNHHI